MVRTTTQVRAQSEDDADDELLSVALLKGDKKVIAGTQSGVINLYSWGHMDDCSDRFPGTPYNLISYCTAAKVSSCQLLSWWHTDVFNLYATIQR